MERRGIHTNVASEPKRRDVVCIYSHADEAFYLQLKKSLKLLERAGEIRWLEVFAGEEAATIWQCEVKCANLILLLLSPDFFADELCYQTMHLALQEQMSRQVPVVPILVRAVNWRLSACKDLDIVPRNEQPIASWSLPDEAYASIGTDLVHVVPGWPPIPSPAHPRMFQARDLPKGYVPRPKAFGEIKHLLLNCEGNQTTAITTALRGAGGFGKTTLALALCHDPDIQAAFPDGILWVELGEQPPRSLDVLNGVLHALEPSLSGGITLEEARENFRVALQERMCMLVIDDVWQTTALEPLLEGGSQCVRLVTTRNNQVLPEEATCVLVDVMEPEEAIAVLGRGLLDEIQHAVYQPRLMELAKRLGYWPLLLTLAHGMLTSFAKRGQTIEKALTTIEKAYQTRGVTAFHQEHANERQQTADACLEVSLRHLKKITPTRYDAIARYHELAVFPEDTDIPLTTLQIYWQGTGGLEDWETEDLCVCLDDLSLILLADLGKGTLRLHDVFRSYLIQHIGSQLAELHARLLDAYQQMFGLTRWADLPRSEVYLWHHLIFHICQAGRREALQTILTDLIYLTRKALYVGISALEADLWLASTVPSTGTAEPASPSFASLHRSIVSISHLLGQVQTEAEMGGLLLSHLGLEASFAAQQLSLECTLPRPFLTAWHPLLGGSSSVLLRTLHGHLGSVTGCAVSPDGSFIVSASSDKTLKVWDAATGVERLTFSGHIGPVHSCAVSPDGSFIVSASFDRLFKGTLKVWDAATGVERLTLPDYPAPITGCAVSPDGSFIVSACGDRTLKVWDAATGVERLTLSGHTAPITGCAVSPDGSFLVSASDDGTLKIWDTATGVERLTLFGHTGSGHGCAVSPDGSFITSACYNPVLKGILKMWDTATGVERLTLSGHTGWINASVVSPNGRFVVSASNDGTLKVWDAATGVERLTLSGHTGSVTGCAVSPNGRFIVSASGDHTLKIWDAATGAKQPTLSGHTGSVTGCAVSPDGSFIVSASDDHTLKIWDAATGVERLTLSGHTDSVKGCAVSPDSRFIVSTFNDPPFKGILKVWDATTGAEQLTLSGHTGSFNDCAVSPDGSFIVCASEFGPLEVWDAATGVERLTLSGHASGVNGCAISPDSSFIVSASEGGWEKTLKVWDAATGAERLTLSGHTSTVTGCAVSPDGSFIVSASWDHTLKIWDAATGVERLTLSGHTSGVSGCAISPDGSFIISASWDNTLKVWDGRTGLCILTFPVDGALLGCAFHPDGEHLVACGIQGVFFLRLVV